jgi:competence protein ComGC
MVLVRNLGSFSTLDCCKAKAVSKEAGLPLLVPQMTTQTRRVTTGGFNNAAMMAARQRQIAMMRQNAQAQARQQAAAAGLTRRTAFNRFGGENGNMLILSNGDANDIRSGRTIDRRGVLTRTSSGRPASLLTAFALLWLVVLLVLGHSVAS